MRVVDGFTVCAERDRLRLLYQAAIARWVEAGGHHSETESSAIVVTLKREIVDAKKVFLRHCKDHGCSPWSVDF
jgi:hypothetical protein